MGGVSLENQVQPQGFAGCQKIHPQYSLKYDGHLGADGGNTPAVAAEFDDGANYIVGGYAPVALDPAM
ncbi:hypothetical protein GJAV_G00239940 [Gymnothorax javanicus]|nr:hypothetical protein GJAV_G00239940 [Gymnothorax javanicus]